jgi:hypothetical protein
MRTMTERLLQRDWFIWEVRRKKIEKIGTDTIIVTISGVKNVIAAIKRLQPQNPSVREEVHKTVGYFETNQDRMRYAEWIKHGLFVGSGVIEAGCKTIVGQRLKQSGMRWTVRGANAIIALRCCQISGRWEEFWGNRATG